jgi:hypothetical protein
MFLFLLANTMQSWRVDLCSESWKGDVAFYLLILFSYDFCCCSGSSFLHIIEIFYCFVFVFLIVVLDGNTLWHLQKFLKCIKYTILEITHLYCSPLSLPSTHFWNSFKRYHFSIYRWKGEVVVVALRQYPAISWTNGLVGAACLTRFVSEGHETTFAIAERKQ